jgi:PAS domain S-box-containing protein
MFSLRSAQGRAILGSVVLVVAIAGIATVAVWRIEGTRERNDKLEHTSAAANALEQARAQTFLAATWVATSAFADDPAPLHDLYGQAALASREALDEARAELSSIDATDDLAAVDGLRGQMDELTQELETLWAFSLTADRDARIETAQREMMRLWPLSMAVIGGLEELAREQQSKLVDDVAAANRTADTTLWLFIGLTALAFAVAAGLGVLVLSVVRPLAALRASARAITAGEAEARASVFGPEEVASLARDFNAMTDALAAKTQEYIDTTNLTGVLILRVNKDNRVSLVNDAMCEFLGRARQEILATPMLDYLHPDDALSTIRAIRKMVQSKGLVTGVVSRHVTPMGTRVTEWSGYPIFDEEGRYAGVHGTGRDITERKEAEEALRESEGRYRLLAENATDVIWTMDTNLRFTYVSPSITQLRGYTVQEVMGQTLKQMLTPASLEIAKKAIAAEQAIEESEGKNLSRSPTVEVEQTCKDGSTVWVEAKFTILRDPDGQPVGTLGITRDISERKRAEDALRESEEKYRRLVQDSIDGIAIVEGLEVTLANRAIADMFGYETEQEVVGRPFTDLVAPEYRKLMVDRGYAREKGQKVPERYEFRALRKDGSEFDAEISVSRIAYQGRVARQGVIKDISERKRAEEALRESEERFHRLSDATFEGLAIHDKGKILDANEAYARMFGYDLSEVIGMHALDFAAPESRDLVWQSILSGRREPFEAIGLRKDGTTFVGEVSGKAIPYRRRMITVAAIRDITERKRAEEALRESEEKFRNIFQSASDAIIYLDTSGVILDVNDKAVDLFGGPREELLGKQFTTVGVFQREDLPAIMSSFGSILAGEEANVQIRIKNRKGEHRFLDCSGSSLKTDGKTPGVVVVVARDITERKRAEKALQKAREEIESRVERRTQEVNGYNLTFRELTILHLVAAGESDKEIATVLGISPLTAHKHLANILEKMGAASRTEAGVRAIREELLD